MHRYTVIFVFVAVVGSTAVLPAQNRQDLQIQSDLRQLSEQVNRLQLTVNQLAEQVKAVNGRVDQVAETNSKSAANQQLSITNVTTAIGTLRENMQDNTVRVSQLAQEFGAVRSGLRLLTDQLNSLVSLLQPAAAPVASSATGADGTPTVPATGAATGGAPLGAVAVPSSPVGLLRSAQNDYHSGRYDLAIEGFQEYLEKFPDGTDAHSAQLHIGESYYQKKMCQQAIPAYQKVVDSYRSSDSVPLALLMLGICNSDLNRRTQATSFYQELIKRYPESVEALQAKQRVDGMRR